MHPLIGIPSRAGLRGEMKKPMYYSNKAYVQAIEDAGGVPILIPILKDIQRLSTLLPHINGLLLPGGIDIHPSCYQEEEHPTLQETDRQLDKLELALTRWALQKDIPVLGICRGLQMINVASGGTLYQDLASEYAGSLHHANGNMQPGEITHSVQIDPGSQIEKVLGVREVPANSLHHQAIKKPGTGIIISGRSEDSVVELIELPGKRFVLAVQCHPEELYSEHPTWARLFEAFINASLEKRAEKVENELTTIII
ncbi:MAG: gamma-glutamyl-gamma-aminobutyrate hydrolase family protein [Ktedonobacteraceae bacterium]